VIGELGEIPFHEEERQTRARVSRLEYEQQLTRESCCRQS
jgi:hypothetical protein